MDRNALSQTVEAVSGQAIKAWTMPTAATFLILCPARLLACPSCKDHLAANGLDTGYAVSILIMILAPLSIVATWVVLILRLRSQNC